MVLLSRETRTGVYLAASREVEGVSGFHVMAIEWEAKVPEIVEGAGHNPHLETAGAFGRLLTEFLSARQPTP